MSKTKDITAVIVRWSSYLVRFILVVEFLGAVYEGRIIVVFLSAVTLFLLFALPRFIRRSWRVVLPIEFEFAIAAFLFASLFLGSAGGYYEKFWWWDLVLHTGAGFGFALVGFLMLYAFYAGGKLKAKPEVITLLAFSFSMSLGALWEILEFTIDRTLGASLQSGGLVDTMWDLIVNAVGAVLVSISGYFYIKWRKDNMFRRLVRRFVETNASLFS